MRITDAYIINIYFDKNISSKLAGIYIFTTLKETKEIVKQALIDVTDRNCEIMGYQVPIKDVIANDKILEAFIEDCGDFYAEWGIEIDKV